MCTVVHGAIPEACRVAHVMIFIDADTRHTGPNHVVATFGFGGWLVVGAPAVSARLRTWRFGAADILR